MVGSLRLDVTLNLYPGQGRKKNGIAPLRRKGLEDGYFHEIYCLEDGGRGFLNFRGLNRA